MALDAVLSTLGCAATQRVIRLRLELFTGPWLLKVLRFGPLAVEVEIRVVVNKEATQQHWQCPENV